MKTQADFFENFTGALSLSNVLGTSYSTHNQSGALTLSASGNKVVNGCATIPIVANGSAINVDADWLLIGGDEISTNVGDTNHIIVTWTGDKYYYSNKVEPA